MTTEQKIIPILLGEAPIAVAAGAGDTTMVKYAIGQAADILKDKAKREWKKQPAPTVGDFSQAIPQVETQLVERFSYFRSMGISVEMRMILACVAREGKAALYVFDNRGLATPAHDSPGYVCIGSGFVTGGNLLLRQLYTGTLDVDQGATLAAYIIDQVSKVDTAVGSFEGESYYFRIQERKPTLGQLKPEAFLEYKAKVAEREKLIKNVWEASYAIGPDELRKMIEESLAKRQEVLAESKRTVSSRRGKMRRK